MMQPAAAAAPASGAIVAGRVAEKHAEARLFTFFVDGARFALPVARVQTVFRIERVTPAPFAPAAVLGLVNLRGKIVTAVSLRRRLGLDEAGGLAGAYAICVENGGESVGLVVDEVGDVLRLSADQRLPPPPHIAPERAAVTTCVYRLDEGMLPLLDADTLLTLE